jgi:hypothetical protein
LPLFFNEIHAPHVALSRPRTRSLPLFQKRKKKLCASPCLLAPSICVSSFHFVNPLFFFFKFYSVGQKKKKKSRPTETCYRH